MSTFGIRRSGRERGGGVQFLALGRTQGGKTDKVLKGGRGGLQFVRGEPGEGKGPRRAEEGRGDPGRRKQGVSGGGDDSRGKRTLARLGRSGGGRHTAGAGVLAEEEEGADKREEAAGFHGR